ncbi:hypothetical protein CB0940_00364 [Cercospora beticola]|uniref:Uncharacterized protein n=1 Tax=Cercospora beticola TaxID=122368 RepID=A0A2G5I9I7_CERBT|nr:hypothetical protein CB0940_00364 [Cercospora beticola]PIB01487.1 hypothetical protein CB0940_00364 [Cercospora beticola]WPA95777.1 hypothetical protein RHO25_000380 [Cercospora beticola]CAK1355971.1 unnamed protein product [Cercospora beticola]
MRVATIILSCASLALAGNVFARDDTCTSDDACESVCRGNSQVSGTLDGKSITPNEAVQAEARRRYQDYHCVSSKCQCAITSDDQAQRFCEYWIENAKDEFNGARYENGGLDQDNNSIYCVYVTVVGGSS